jgi:beta-glucosidase
MTGVQTIGLVVFAVSVLRAFSAAKDAPSTAPGWPRSALQRAEETLASMALDDKLSLLHGFSGPYAGNIPALSQYGLPALQMEDGPQGVADGVELVTAWPSAATVSMSWDRNLMYQFGQAMATEEKAKGANFLLGPGTNTARIPWSGRVFEYLAPEEPYLASELIGYEVQGIQSQNISAVVKHGFMNSIEDNRTSVVSKSDWRPFMEQYSRPFEAAVRAGVGALMCSYNKIQLGSSPAQYACENTDTLGWLYQDANFKGITMSDWWAIKTMMPAVNAGVTMEMPDGAFFGAPLKEAVANGSISQSQIDLMALRVLYPLYAIGLVDDPIVPTKQNLGVNVTSAAHNLLARTLAEQSTVLLKNEGNILPLNKDEFRSILVVGDASTVVGWGSGGAQPPYVTTPWGGLQKYLNNGGRPIQPRPAGCRFMNDTAFEKDQDNCVSCSSKDDCCAKCTERADCAGCTFVSGSYCAMPPQGEALPPVSSFQQCFLHQSIGPPVAAPGKIAGVCAPQPTPQGPYNILYNNTQNATIAAILAESFDVVIMNVAVNSGEGHDRQNLSLPMWQDQMVSAVASVNKRTIVVARCAGACEMPWIDEVPAVIFQFLPGQECGNALARVLLGEVNPSGKLPLTFPHNMKETWIKSAEQYPGVQLEGDNYPTSFYTEGLFWGYRWYDEHNLEPLFPFGHGLSYSTFQYSDLKVNGTIGASDYSSTATVSFQLQNVKGPAGAEVAQLYLGFPSEANEPPKLLRGFSKVLLNPGQSSNVTLTLGYEDVRIFDEEGTFDWIVLPGQYEIFVGSSSRDIRLRGNLSVCR